MATTFRIYKGNSIEAEGASPLEIIGLLPETEIAAGVYTVVRVLDGRESARVVIPGFKTLADDTNPIIDSLPIGEAVIGVSNRVV